MSITEDIVRCLMRRMLITPQQATSSMAPHNRSGITATVQSLRPDKLPRPTGCH
jgi:hypothetical protein